MINSKTRYYSTNKLKVKNGGVSVWQGIRALENKYLICGTTEPGPQTGIGIIYIGDICCHNGYINYLVVPNSLSTSVYGPNYNKKNKLFNFVGSFVDQSNNTKGFVYTGKLVHNNKTLSKPQNFVYPCINNDYSVVFIHSIMNGLYVGNCGNTNGDNTLSFLYNIHDNVNYTKINFPNALTTTTYGIWYNGDNIYTIVGGYSMEKKISINKIYSNGLTVPFGNNFIAFYNSKTNTFYNWTTIALPFDSEIISHIEGIYGDCEGNYSLSFDILGNNDESGGYYAVIVPYNDTTNNYKIQKFVSLNNKLIKLSSNSVAHNCVVGLIIDGNEPFQGMIIN